MPSHRPLIRILLAVLSSSLVLGALPAAAAPHAYVANTGAHVVSVIDTATVTVLGTIPVGESPVRLAVTQDGTRAYVTNTHPDSDSVSVIHTATRTVVATVPVAVAPSAVAVTPDGAEVYVAAAGGVLQVLETARIGTGSDPVIATLSFGATTQTATSVAILPDGTRAYALVSGSLRVIDTATHTVLRSVYVGISPSRVAISPDGTRAYVTNSFGFNTFGFDGQLVVVDTGTDAVLSTIPLVGLPVSLAVTPDGARAYVAIASRFSSGGIAGGFVPATTITVIDLAASVVSGSISLPGTPAGVAVTADGSRVYVAVPGTSSLAVIDTTTDTLVTTIGVAAGPSDVAIVPAPPLPGCEDGAPCDDDNACTTGDACLGGFCVGGPPPDCNDDDVCTDDTCNSAFGCVHAPNTAPCDDGNACTTGDTCAGGTCVGSPDCNDNDVCTNDACVPASGCVHTPNTVPCDDGNACTTGDTCAAGTCVGGPPRDCNDGNACTDDACDPAAGCLHVTASCDDGNACTTNDACVGGACVGGPPRDCNDGNACTDDACDPASGCVHTPDTAPCDDGNVCTTGDVCVDGMCRGTGDPDCEDLANAYVTNMTTHVVSMIDTATDMVLGTVPVGLSPTRVAVTRDGARAYVTNTASDSVSVIDAGRSLATVPVADAPSAVAVTPDGAEVYVVAAGGVLQVLETARIGTGSDPVIATLSFGATTQTATSVAILPDGTRAYAVVSGSLRVIDAATHTVLRSVYVGTSPSRVAISPDGTRAYVTNSFGFDTFGFDGQLVVVDTGTDAVLSTIPLVGLPASLVVTPDGARAYVAITSRFSSGGIAGGFVPATTITVIDLAANVVSGSIPLPGTPAGVAITADGGRVYVAVPGTSSLAVFDTTTDTLVTTIGVAAGPSDVAIVPAPLLPGCEDGAPCDDGNACTTGDACLGSFCVGGPRPDCNDDDVCTNDFCNPAFGCAHAPNTAPCDDGNACTLTDVCLLGVCAGGDAIVCAPPNQCHQVGICDPATGACTDVPKVDGTICNDVDPCTTPDTCAAGSCVGGPARNCNDGNPCTEDSCNPASGCVTTPNSVACDDGNACTTNDTCAGGVCRGGPAPACNDGNPCTTDSCNPASGCVTTNNTAPCSDGNPCTSGDACAAGVCRGGPAPTCNDGNSCTTDSCNPATGCVHTPNTAACSDGNACTTGDTCAAGACRGGPAPNCNDGNPCTTDSCNPASGCVNANNTAPCDDGNPCTAGDTCAAGACRGGPPLVCDDGNACNGLETCDPQVGCRSTVPTACAETVADVTVYDEARTRNFGADPVLWADARTAKRTFLRFRVTGTGIHPVPAATLRLRVANAADASSDSGGRIRRISNCSWAELLMTWNTQPAIDGPVLDTAGPVTSGNRVEFDVTPAITGDGLYCFVLETTSTDGVIYDSRETATGPQLLLTLGAGCTADIDCDDGDHCNGVETCVAGICRRDAASSCNDGNPCTTDSCNPATGCVTTNNTAPCDDGNPCTTGDTCAAGACRGGPAPSCNDGNPCTTDSCNPASGCVNTPNTAACSDGNACTTGDTCAAGACRGGPAPNCNDGNPCTTDSCNPASGCVNANNTAPCDDGTACTTGDTCAAGACRGGPAPNCNDGNPCTTDSCNPTTGCVNTPNTTACSDGNACTTGDTCAAGACRGGPAPNCNDGNPCTTDSCNPASGCVNANNTAPCDDGNPCTAGDTCAAGRCQSGPPLVCDDGNACNGLETCDPQVGCRLSFPTACADAAADVTVYEEARTRNFGADPALWADARSVKRTFLRFEVTGTGNRPVLGAALRLRVANASDAPSDSGGRIRRISNCSWAELLMTWNTQPAIDGPILDTAGPVTSGNRVEFDVTPAITADGLYCFVLESTSSNGVIYDSRETATGPQLTLTLDAGCTADIDCDDSDHCNGVETCVAGICRSGAASSCNDGNPCTTDSCNPTTGCVTTNNTAACSDGNACTTGDTCAAGACRGGPAPSCNDGNPCTTDSCNPTTGCVNTPNTAACSDGNACTTGDTCAAGTCRGGPAPSCNDGNPCTTDSCNPASGCVNANNTAPCDDGNPCTAGDTCAAGACRGGPPLVCDDGNACNGLETCDPQVGCRLSFPTACADAAADVTVYEEARTRNFGVDPALWADARSVKRTFLRFEVTGTGLQPVLGAVLRLQVANAADAPSDSGGRIRRISNCSWAELLMTWNTQPAIDGPILDTAGPVTSGNRVEFDVTPAITADGLYCFVLESTSSNGVIYDSRETATGPQLTLTLDAGCTTDIDCDDGIHCNGAETCTAGLCRPGAPVDCSNLTDMCNDGVCDETRATCVRRPRPDGTSCDDGDRCNGLATCDAETGLCVPGMPVPCGDGNACNGLEICDPLTGQCRPGAAIVCNDGNTCNGLETCDPLTGQCRPGTGAACNDGNPCTTDSCNPAAGCVNTNNTAPCNDGNNCTTGDRCAGGTCQTGAPLVCDDAEMCNGLEACDPQTGQCRVTVAVPDGTSCDDDDLCNGLEACDAASGQCQVSQAVLCEALEADVTVFQKSPRTPLGAESVLWADADSAKHTFLRVSANGVGTATVVSAVLRLHVATVTDAESVSAGRIRKISACGWNELTTTWNTRPAIDGPVLDEVGAVAAGDEVEFDITAGISGEGPHCFAIESGSSDGVVYSSRETARAPEVEIVLDRP